MGEGGGTENGEGLGDWAGASLTNSASSALRQPPCPGEVPLLLLRPPNILVLVRAPLCLSSFSPTRWHLPPASTSGPRFRVGKRNPESLEALTNGGRRLGDWGMGGRDHESLKGKFILEPGPTLLLPSPHPHFPAHFGPKGMSALFNTLEG